MKSIVWKPIFSQFWDGFDMEVQRYIAQQRKERGKACPSVVDLEDELGPIWLLRHQAITRDMDQVLGLCSPPDHALMKARREKMLASIHAPESGARHGQPDAVCTAYADQRAVDFGTLLPGGGRDRIETWLNNEARDSAPPKPCSSFVASEVPNAIDLDFDRSELSLAERWLRVKSTTTSATLAEQGPQIRIYSSWWIPRMELLGLR